MIPPIIIRIVGKDAFSATSNKISKEIGQFGKGMQSVGRNMSMYVTAPMTLFAASTLKASGDFEYGMNRVAAISGATGAEFDMLEKRAMDLGESTVFTANQVTEGMQLMAQAGLGVENTYKGIETVLNNASANMIDMGESALITSGLMKAYKKPIEDIADVTDIMTKTSIASMSNFTELSEAFLYAGPTAAAMGKSLEETSAVLGQLANGMMKGSMAGTSMRGMMAKLTAPTAEAVSIMQSLGISYDDILDKKGNLRSFVDVIKAFENTGITAGEVLQIFGLRAGPGFQILLNAGSKSLEDMLETVKDFGGTTKRIADIQLQGFHGQIWKLVSAFQGLQISIAKSGILLIATDIASAFTDWFRVMSKFHPTLLKWGFILGIVAAALGPLIFLFGTLIAMVPFFIAGFGMLPLLLTGLLAPLALVFIKAIVVTALIALLISQWDEMKEVGSDVFDELKYHWNEFIEDIKWGFGWITRVATALANLEFGKAWDIAKEGWGGSMGTQSPEEAERARIRNIGMQYMGGMGGGYIPIQGVLDVNVKSNVPTDVSGSADGIDLNMNQGRDFGSEWE